MSEHAATSGDSAGDLALLSDLIDRAAKAGADAADAVLLDSQSLSLAQRLGKPERVERAENSDLGLRVFVGRRMALVSSADRTPDALAEIVDRAIAMARATPEDAFCGLAEPDEIATTWDLDALDLADPVEPAAETLMVRAAEAEDAALAVAGVTNSDGAEAGWHRARVAMFASNGFAGSYAITGQSVSASVIAGEGTGMETDYDYSSAAYGDDLDDPAEVGRSAGQRAVGRLGARKIETARMPVVLDQRVAGSLVRHLVGAISGPAIARGTSFLKDRMGEEIFGPGIRIIDDPLRPRGHRSKPFDGEGIATRRQVIVDNGRLATWLLDLRSARQLQLRSTGHASRGTASPPGPAPTNLFLEPGPATVTALLADIDQGFYVTQMMGMGVNGITGDYSRGASGFAIEGGKIAYPVNEVTIAGNLKEMFRALTPADDLRFRTGVDSPTVRVDGMTVAGR